MNKERLTEIFYDQRETFNSKKGLLLIYDTEVKASDIPETIEIVPVWRWLLKKRS